MCGQGLGVWPGAPVSRVAAWAQQEASEEHLGDEAESGGWWRDCAGVLPLLFLSSSQLSLLSLSIN